MTTGVIVSTKEIKENSLAHLERETHRIRMQESNKVRPSSRQELIARSNARMLVIRRRPAKLKAGLEFSGLGPWGF